MPHDACIGHRAAFSFCFTLSRIPTAKTYHFVTMYYPHPCLLAKSPIAKQNLSHRANVICDGSPSRIRSVRRISLGMTTRPRSSMRRTIPVAFIVAPPMLFILPRFWLQGYCLQRKEKYSGARRRRAVRIKKAKVARDGFGFFVLMDIPRGGMPLSPPCSAAAGCSAPWRAAWRGRCRSRRRCRSSTSASWPAPP